MPGKIGTEIVSRYLFTYSTSSRRVLLDMIAISRGLRSREGHHTWCRTSLDTHSGDLGLLCSYSLSRRSWPLTFSPWCLQLKTLGCFETSGINSSDSTERSNINGKPLRYGVAKRVVQLHINTCHPTKQHLSPRYTVTPLQITRVTPLHSNTCPPATQ
jgi:hypothetical protein